MKILRHLFSPLRSHSSVLFDKYLLVWLKVQSCISEVPWQQLRPLCNINSRGFCVASVIIPGKGSVSILCPCLSFLGRGVRHLARVSLCVCVCICVVAECLWVHVRELYSHTCSYAKLILCAQYQYLLPLPSIALMWHLLFNRWMRCDLFI